MESDPIFFFKGPIQCLEFMDKNILMVGTGPIMKVYDLRSKQIISTH